MGAKLQSKRMPLKRGLVAMAAAPTANVFAQSSPAQMATSTLWTGHINDFVNYVVATKIGNTAGQNAAVAALEQYKTQFAAFLNGADPYMNATVLADSPQVHVNQLLATFNAYVAKNYPSTESDFVTAYEHMFMDGVYRGPPSWSNTRRSLASAWSPAPRRRRRTCPCCRPSRWAQAWRWRAWAS